MISSNAVLDPGHLARVVERIGNEGAFFFDYETIPSTPGADDRGVPARNQALWIGLATRGLCVQVPMGHPIGTKVVGERTEVRIFSDGKPRNFKIPVYEKAPEQMDRGTVFELLNPLFADPDIVQSAHGATFDAASGAKYRGGLIPAGRIACTIEMKHLTDENRMRYGLKYVVKDDYGMSYDDKSIGKEVEKHTFRDVQKYLYLDTQYGWLEYTDLLERIKREGLSELWDMECELTSVLSEMRITGAPMNMPRLLELKDELGTLVGVRERDFYAAAGRKVNLNSPVQMQTLLYKDLGLKPWKMTKGGKDKVEAARRSGQKITPDHTFYSTDDESLDEFRGHPVVDALLAYRETNKVYGTYVIGYLGDPEAKDKPCRVFPDDEGNYIIYPDFVQYAAATGRFGCRDPNLQNVPAPRTDLGKMIRGLFGSKPGWKLIVADYGQIELVLLAHFIGYGAFYDGFIRGIDPHVMTAAMALNEDPDWFQAQVDAGVPEYKNNRQRYGKSINFATVYGAWLNKLASMMSVSVEEAGRFKDTYDSNTPEINEYRQEMLQDARRHSKRRDGQPPHTTTLLGRKRRMPELMSADKKVRQRAERQVFNARIQGSSADLTKTAMVRFNRRKKELGRDHWKILLTVHDEIVVTAPDDEAEAARDLLVWAMVGPGIAELVSLPMKVDVHIVDSWDKAK